MNTILRMNRSANLAGRGAQLSLILTFLFFTSQLTEAHSFTLAFLPFTWHTNELCLCADKRAVLSANILVVGFAVCTFCVYSEPSQPHKTISSYA